MGTRHLICVVLDSEYKVAQYGQWDGYPGGQGIDVLNFLHTRSLMAFKEKVKNTYWLTAEQVNETWEACGKNPEQDWVSMGIFNLHTKLFPNLSRDTGSKILDLILDNEGRLGLWNSLEFAKDSLFCEWCYVIDLDKNTLEIFKGFNNDPLDPSERFYFDGAFETSRSDPETRYYPVRQVQEFDLDNLPSESVFLEILSPPDEDE